MIINIIHIFLQLIFAVATYLHMQWILFNGISSVSKSPLEISQGLRAEVKCMKVVTDFPLSISSHSSQRWR